MMAHHQQIHNHSYSEVRITHEKNKQTAQGFQFPHDPQDVLYNIWETYKKAIYVRPPLALSQERNKAVLLMMQCHKIMKLPIQTLFLATSVLDKVLNTNYQLNQLQSKNELSVNILGIASLYSCQKLEKIRNYGVSHWLKHLSIQNLSSIGYYNIGLSPDSLKKYEACIMQTMNYNLFSSTLFDILLGIWTLKIPTQKQFYFSQYLLELSLFTHLSCLSSSKKQSYIGTNTVQSLTQIVEGQETEKHENTLVIDVAIAIANLSAFFFGNQPYSNEFLTKTIWRELDCESKHKQMQLKKKLIKNISNQLFQKVLSIESDPYCQKIVQKYGKHSNYGVSSLKFMNRSNLKLSIYTNESNNSSQVLKHSQSQKAVTWNNMRSRNYYESKIQQQKNESLNDMNLRSI